MFGKTLWLLRRENKLSQKKLGEMIGASRSAVNFWEMDAYNPSLKYIKKIEDVLKIKFCITYKKQKKGDIVKKIITQI